MALNMIRNVFGDNRGAGFEAFQASLRDAGLRGTAYPALEAPGYFRASSGRFLLRRLPGRSEYSLRVSGIPWGHALEIPLLSARERLVHFTIRLTLVTNSLVTSGISSSTVRVV